jgi:hypothetical protein
VLLAVLPLWADILIIAAIPVILLAAVWLADENPDNMTVHHQQDEPRDEDEPDLIAEAA